MWPFPDALARLRATVAGFQTLPTKQKPSRTRWQQQQPTIRQPDSLTRCSFVHIIIVFVSDRRGYCSGWCIVWAADRKRVSRVLSASRGSGVELTRLHGKRQSHPSKVALSVRRMLCVGTGGEIMMHLLVMLQTSLCHFEINCPAITDTLFLIIFFSPSFFAPNCDLPSHERNTSCTLHWWLQ